MVLCTAISSHATLRRVHDFRVFVLLLCVQRQTTRPTTARMPQKHRGEEGVKSKGRKKSDKAARNFELHGTYSAKHLRLIGASRERQAEARRTNT